MKDGMLLSKLCCRKSYMHCQYSLVCLLANMNVINNLHPATNITSPCHSLSFLIQDLHMYKILYIQMFLKATSHQQEDLWFYSCVTQGAFVWAQSGIRIIGIMRVSVCLGAICIPEYLDFHSGYSAPRSRITGMYYGIYSGFLFRNISNKHTLSFIPVSHH